MHVNFFQLVFEINCRDNPAVWIHVVMSTHDTSAQYKVYWGLYLSGRERERSELHIYHRKLPEAIPKYPNPHRESTDAAQVQ